MSPGPEARSTGPSPRNQLAAELRRAAALTVGQRIDDEAYRQATAMVREAVEMLAAGSVPGKRARGTPDPDRHPQDFFPTSPVIGYASPLAPPIDLWSVEMADGMKELRGRARFDYQYEGPPTCVHGGIIAEVFDELLGSVNILNGQGGFTGTLTVRYRRPTPLLAELELQSRQLGREGRKIRAWGGIFHEGALTAEAEGVFVVVGPEEMANIVGTNAERADGPVLDDQWAGAVAARTAGTG